MDKLFTPTTSNISFNDFSSFCVASGYNKPFPKQLEMVTHCNKDGVNLLLASRGYGKTDYIVILNTVFRFIHNKQQTTLIITKEEKRGLQILDTIESLLLYHGIPYYKKGSIIKDIDNIKKEANIKVLSASTKGLRGNHPNNIIVDDLITPETVSFRDRELAYRTYNELKSLTPNITLIGQPVHKSDLYSTLRILKDVNV